MKSILSENISEKLFLSIIDDIERAEKSKTKKVKFLTLVELLTQLCELNGVLYDGMKRIKNIFEAENGR